MCVTCVDTRRDQKRVSDPQELQVVMSGLLWVLGTKLRFALEEQQVLSTGEPSAYLFTDHTFFLFSKTFFVGLFYKCSLWDGDGAQWYSTCLTCARVPSPVTSVAKKLYFRQSQ